MLGGNLALPAATTGTGKLQYELGSLAGTNDLITVGVQLDIGADALGISRFAFTNAGGLEAGTYRLITTPNGILGTLNPADLTGPVGYFMGHLQINNTDLELVVSGSGAPPYAIWANGPGFYEDTNTDGIWNGLAWMLGAADTGVTAGPILPTASTKPGFLTLSFKRVAQRGDAKLKVQYGADLASWTTVELPAASGTVSGGMVVQVSTGVPLETLTVDLPITNAPPGGRLYARLAATEN